MRIPRKLSLSFVLICVSAAVMMAVFFATILMIRSSNESNNLSRSIEAQAMSLETAILRQNSQFRGFLVTGDETYLKSYDEGREEYDQVAVTLKALLEDPAKQALVEQSRVATLAWRRDWGDAMIAAVRAGRREEAQQAVRDAGTAVLVSPAVLPLRELREGEAELTAANGKRQEAAIVTAVVALIIGGIALIAIAVTLSILLSRTIARPITTLTEAMDQLAKGDNNITVDSERADELGDMARAVLVFRDTALAKAEADAAKALADKAKAEAERGKAEADEAQRHVVEALDTALEALAAGDLTHLINTPFAPEYERLRKSFNVAVEGLEQSISGVAASAQSVRSSATQIYSASENLSRRTEQQASSLQETTSATNQVTRMVGETARSATNAQDAISVANSDAADGRAIVDEAISAMGAIETGSQEIAEIINMIDAIALQTNLLALNAGVEAARAGDSGRGFAVVAGEVRQLAKRTADAAKDIKVLITKSSEEVKCGVDRVGETGRMLARVVAKISDTNALITEIAEGAQTQADNLKQVNGSVASMDNMTQQNAAMAEEATAGAGMLATEADELATLVSRFRLRSTREGREQSAQASYSAGSSATSAKPRRAVPQVSGNLALSMPEAEGEWDEF
ncbi:MAG: methyl-accepting chemotaxis protein [Brevundimonas sp.]|uniref:methyl-accepting chemotaxis protein n=1 Tax=Brevundimonas sp. TaxID=1871086 RepID=UPI002732606F|nr:methyl-accepting chemotaxis protein [Brevundimonas sp.]MDP3403122.1 methyl-accepting chemotaxis protein [Brevundimonas sp.]